MDLKPGDRVLNPRQPDWGPGEILTDNGAGKLHVYFAYAGEKVLKGVPLEPVGEEVGDHPLIANRRSKPPRKGLKHQTIPECIDRFLEVFPGGFSDPKYLEEERNYKVDASSLMNSTLPRDVTYEMISRGAHSEVCAGALQVVKATNLVFPNEKMALREALKSVDNERLFAGSLCALLFGEGNWEQRFAQWAETLCAINAGKWTLATYFQFLAFPGEFVFLKPSVTKDAAEVCNFELNYRTELNPLTYVCVQRFASVLRNEIATLEPRDMIDVQSFIWHIAPGR